MQNYFVNREMLAKFFGLSSQRISQFVAQGMPQQGHDRYNLIACTKFYIQLLRSHNEGANSTIANERLNLIKAQAERAVLENQKLRNKIVDVEEITQDIMLLTQQLRDSLLGIPGRLSHELVGKTEAEIRYYLEMEIKQSMDKTAEKLDAMVEAAKDQTNVGKTENVCIESSSGNIENEMVSQRG